jgi:hypothetical protein
LLNGTFCFIFIGTWSYLLVFMTVKKDPDRTYVSLSFSCPPSMETDMNRQAAKLRMSRSEYLRRLIERDLYQAGFLSPMQQQALEAPPRIRRGKKK